MKICFAFGILFLFLTACGAYMASESLLKVRNGDSSDYQVGRVFGLTNTIPTEDFYRTASLVGYKRCLLTRAGTAANTDLSVAYESQLKVNNVALDYEQHC